jgi:hypothetical protein
MREPEQHRERCDNVGRQGKPWKPSGCFAATTRNNGVAFDPFVRNLSLAGLSLVFRGNLRVAPTLAFDEPRVQRLVTSKVYSKGLTRLPPVGARAGLGGGGEQDEEKGSV